MKEWKLKKVDTDSYSVSGNDSCFKCFRNFYETMQQLILIRKNQNEPTRFKSANGVRNTGNNIPDLNEQIQTELPQIAITFDDGQCVHTGTS